MYLSDGLDIFASSHPWSYPELYGDELPPNASCICGANIIHAISKKVEREDTANGYLTYLNVFLYSKMML
jgi:hypothetical protein